MENKGTPTNPVLTKGCKQLCFEEISQSRVDPGACQSTITPNKKVLSWVAGWYIFKINYFSGIKWLLVAIIVLQYSLQTLDVHMPVTPLLQRYGFEIGMKPGQEGREFGSPPADGGG